MRHQIKLTEEQETNVLKALKNSEDTVEIYLPNVGAMGEFRNTEYKSTAYGHKQHTQKRLRFYISKDFVKTIK